MAVHAYLLFLAHTLRAYSEAKHTAEFSHASCRWYGNSYNYNTKNTEPSELSYLTRGRHWRRPCGGGVVSLILTVVAIAALHLCRFPLFPRPPPIFHFSCHAAHSLAWSFLSYHFAYSHHARNVQNILRKLVLSVSRRKL